MGKKSKNANITINDEELQSTTIGYLDDAKKGPGLLIGFFAIFVIFALLLPNINGLVNKIFGNDNKKVVVPNGNGTNNGNNQNAVEVVLYDYSDELTFTYNDIEFKEFKGTSTSLTFTIENKTDKAINFKENKYYLETYDAEKMMLGRHIFDNLIIDSKQAKSYTVELYPIEISSVAKLTVIAKTEKDYPDAGVKANDSGETVLTCVKSQSSIAYTFNSDNEIVSIKDIVNYSNDGTQEYSAKLLNYRLQAASNNNKTGVESSVVETTSGFTATTEIDLSKATVKELNNVNYYDKQGINVVNFEMEARGYSCN